MRSIEITKLTKKYNETKVLDNININIKNGVYGLLGPNGAGKTTLIRTIATLLDIEEGKITYSDIEWKDKNEVKNIIGYLPQDFYIYKNLSVKDILYHLCMLKNVDKHDIENEIERVLKETDLFNNQNKKVKELSGGMLRRLGIAQAIINNPPILIIDEPTTGLDPAKRIEFRRMLSRLSENRIIIISTHIVEDIESTCNQVCILNEGKISYEGNLENMKSLADGYIYECIIDKSEFESIEKNLNIIYIATVMNAFKIRFISKDKPLLSHANKVHPTLEDAYLYIIGDNDVK